MPRKLTNKDRRSIAVMVFGFMIVAGATVLLMALITLQGYAQITQDKYLTDPAIPHDQMENASYTITADEILSGLKAKTTCIYTGSAIFACGYAALLASTVLIPSRKDDHKANCSSIVILNSAKVEYCPICGIELKTLEKKG